MSTPFEEIFDVIVRTHGLTSAPDMAVARSLTRLMVDDRPADPVRQAEAIVRLRALLPVPAAAADGASWDLGKLSTSQLATLHAWSLIATGAAPPEPVEPEPERSERWFRAVEAAAVLDEIAPWGEPYLAPLSVEDRSRLLSALSGLCYPLNIGEIYWQAAGTAARPADPFKDFAA